MQRQPETLDADVTVPCNTARQTVGDERGYVTDKNRHCDVISGDVAHTENCFDVTFDTEMERSETEVSSSQSLQLHVVDHTDKVMSLSYPRECLCHSFSIHILNTSKYLIPFDKKSIIIKNGVKRNCCTSNICTWLAKTGPF